MVIDDKNRIMTRSQSRKKVNSDTSSHNSSVHSNNKVENMDQSQLDNTFLPSLDDELVSTKEMVEQRRVASHQKKYFNVVVTVKINNDIFFPDLTTGDDDNSMKYCMDSFKGDMDHCQISCDSDSDVTVDYDIDDFSEATYVYMNPDLQTN